MHDLGVIDHIVVLMFENRSFDHMLGFLTRELGRTDVDGPGPAAGEMVGGTFVPMFPAPSPEFLDDPAHYQKDVAEQLDPARGFASNFKKHLKRMRPIDVLQYQPRRFVPAYDHLAREYCVCDRWYCSFPGPTHPNRLFSLSGHSGGNTANVLGNVGEYPMPTVFDGLRSNQWVYFYRDIPTIWFYKKYFPLKGDRIRPFAEFASRVASGLPPVTYIDPHFGIAKGGKKNGNDDHPPIDVRKAQQLAAEVYNTLAAGPAWSRTMLIITYDEHGGFYDHVSPPPAVPPSAGQARHFSRYGVRVPTLVVSPWVGRGSVVGRNTTGGADVVFDHTSIIKTILTRFAPSADLSRYGERVRQARDLSVLLTERSPRTDHTPIPAIPLGSPSPELRVAAGEPSFAVAPVEAEARVAAAGRRLDPLLLDVDVEPTPDDASFEDSLRYLAVKAFEASDGLLSDA